MILQIKMKRVLYFVGFRQDLVRLKIFPYYYLDLLHFEGEFRYEKGDPTLPPVPPRHIRTQPLFNLPIVFLLSFFT